MVLSLLDIEGAGLMHCFKEGDYVFGERVRLLCTCVRDDQLVAESGRSAIEILNRINFH